MKSLQNHIFRLGILLLSLLGLPACKPALEKELSARADYARVTSADTRVLVSVGAPMYDKPGGTVLSDSATASPAYVLEKHTVDGRAWLRLLMANARIAWTSEAPKEFMSAKVTLRNKHADVTSLPRDREGQAGFSWLQLNRVDVNDTGGVESAIRHYAITDISDDDYLLRPDYIADRGRQIKNTASVLTLPSLEAERFISSLLLPDIRISSGKKSGWLTFQDVSLEFSSTPEKYRGLIVPPFLKTASKIFSVSKSEAFPYISLGERRKVSSFTLSETHELRQMLVLNAHSAISHIRFWAVTAKDDYVFSVRWRDGRVLGFGFNDVDNGIPTPYILHFQHRDFNGDGILDVALYCLMVSGDDEVVERFVVNGAAESLSKLLL